MQLLLIPILLILGIIIYQDFTSRSIHWFTLPPLFIGLTIYTFDKLSFQDIIFNFLFIIVILGSLVVYLRFREGKWVNPTKSFFGWGDILFLFAITPSESTRDFMFLFIIGTTFSLLLTLTLRLMSTKFDVIPYAGMFSIFIISHLIYSYMNPNFSFVKLLN